MPLWHFYIGFAIRVIIIIEYFFWYFEQTRPWLVTKYDVGPTVVMCGGEKWFKKMIHNPLQARWVSN